MKNVIVTQAKDQSERLLPWFLHHYEQGFDTFIFFDDYSEDNTRKIIEDIKNKYQIKIIYCQTDGIGSIRTTEETKNSNIYNADLSLHDRVCRSFNTGLQIVKQVNPEAFVAFIDVDEFLITNHNKKTINIIEELYQNNNNSGHLYVQSFDINDNFKLDGFYTTSEESKYRWDYEARKNSPWVNRGKSIVKANYIDKINPLPNVIHTLFDNGNGGTFIKPFIQVEINDIRIHHFRKPNNDSSMELVYDDCLYNFSLIVKNKYNITDNE